MSTYDQAMFLQILEKKAVKAFGGKTVTEEDVFDAFWAVSPELLEPIEEQGKLEEAQEFIRTNLLEGLIITCDEEGFKVIR